MNSLTPRQVKKRFGPMFSRGFYTLVDEDANLVRIVEMCSAKGPVEWDAVNRRRAGGALRDISVDGETLIMDAKIGTGKVRFGASSSESGGQALKSVEIRGSEVRTTWVGLAGASLGVGACIPQSPGVIRTEYPGKTGNEIRLGGSNSIEVTVVTQKMVRLVIGIDDTDTKDSGATWVMALKLARKLPYATLLQHKIVQLNPKIKEKTTNCAGTAVAFAVEEMNLRRALAAAFKFIKANTLSDHTAMAAFTGLVIPPKLQAYGRAAKVKRLDEKTADKVAGACGVELFEVTGGRGKIGALAAIGCFDMGIRSAAFPGDRLKDTK